MNITLNSQAEAFVQQSLQSGRYRSIDELVNDALCLMGKLKADIQVGIEQADRGDLIDAEHVFESINKKITLAQ
ncbi:type II toxin-antitoxin system ParD family antitoxin [Candidatus Albibeggiatoa sp. nov. BB20]|uniref:ribbon-helix-helix domain-containing protein n=1 Tax=Candidatus Albibeggiatoa sp. nov. BB20 TaxID=3162723 RepID=UPI00336595BB